MDACGHACIDAWMHAYARLHTYIQLCMDACVCATSHIYPTLHISRAALVCSARFRCFGSEGSCGYLSLAASWRRSPLLLLVVVSWAKHRYVIHRCMDGCVCVCVVARVLMCGCILLEMHACLSAHLHACMIRDRRGLAGPSARNRFFRHRTKLA